MIPEPTLDLFASSGSTVPPPEPTISPETLMVMDRLVFISDAQRIIAGLLLFLVLGLVIWGVYRFFRIFF